MLEELGLEIRKASPRENENETTIATTTAEPAAAAAAATGRSSTTGQARLVQILGQGQGGRLESESDATQPLPPGNDWWNVNRRGKSPNLAKHTNAWILVSDGSHSARVYLTIGALKEVFDWDNQNNNEDNLFGRGCCVLLKKYSFECDVDNNNSVQLKVSSLEPKPGFNYHHGTSNTNHANHDDNNSKAIVRPVMEEIDVLYGLQFLTRQRQQQMRNISSDTNNDSDKSTMNSACFARDWDIAFGRLSKGRLTISRTTDEKAEALVDRNRGLVDVLELAEEAASTDEAIREWEMAKKEYGITSSTTNGTNNDSSFHKTQKPMATTTTKWIYGQDGDQEDNDEGEEDLSRMYIQNVLATSDEGEDESENEKVRTSQKEYEGDDDGNLSSDSEEPLLPETQPRSTTLTTTEYAATYSKNTPVIGTPSSVGIAAATGIETRCESKTIASKSKKANDDDDNGILRETMLQIQPAEEEEKESGEDIVEATTKMRRKRPRGNSFESGTASNLTLDEAITGPGSTRKSRNQMRRRRQQQLPLHRQQEHPHNSTGIWESIKEQLFEPDRTILYCVPSCLVPSSNGINDNEKMLVTPKRSLASTTSNVKTFGSSASIATNFTSSTPNPSSGAYYRKHGLARWLSQNAINEERG